MLRKMLDKQQITGTRGMHAETFENRVYEKTCIVVSKETWSLSNMAPARARLLSSGARISKDNHNSSFLL